jgi:hypothetical protein
MILKRHAINPEIFDLHVMAFTLTLASQTTTEKLLLYLFMIVYKAFQTIVV